MHLDNGELGMADCSNQVLYMNTSIFKFSFQSQPLHSMTARVETPSTQSRGPWTRGESRTATLRLGASRLMLKERDRFAVSVFEQANQWPRRGRSGAGDMKTLILLMCLDSSGHSAYVSENV